MTEGSDQNNQASEAEVGEVRYVFSRRGARASVRAHRGGDLVGYAHFLIVDGVRAEEDDGDGENSLWVSPRFRGRGVARRMYDLAEKKMGLPIVPSEHLSGDGARFWRSRLRTLPEDHPAHDWMCG